MCEFHLDYLKTTLKIRKDCWLISFVIFIVFFVSLQLSKYREVMTINLNNVKASDSHEYLCALIQNGHEFCKLLLKRPQTVMCLQITFKK